MASDVIMPALGMAQETGKVIQWLKAEGDEVTQGEPLLEVETDKITVEVEAPASGVLANLTANEGDDVPVGQSFAQMVIGTAVAEPELDHRPFRQFHVPADHVEYVALRRQAANEAFEAAHGRLSAGGNDRR